jgi:hypothetical protein
MVKKYIIDSESQIKKNELFSLDNFKKPFCFKEKKNKYKIYQYPKFSDKNFWKIKTSQKKPILVVSGPARNGNHLVISLLDGHSEIIPHPGEDDFLRSFFSFVNLDEKKSILKLKRKDLSFIRQLSGQPNFSNKNPKGTDKWKELYKLYKSNKKSLVWSGNQPENEGHVQDYQDLVPNIDYPNFLNNLKKIKKKNFNNFFDFLYYYLDATKNLANKATKKKSAKYQYRISGSGLRREMFYLMSNIDNIKLICPIRSFEGFYYSYAKTRHKLDKNFNSKALNNMWEHWRHKVIDFLILKKKYPNKVLIVRYEQLTKNTKLTMKKICSFLKIKFEDILLEPTVFNQKSLGNSSFKKSSNLKGKIYKTDNKFPSNIGLPKEYKDIMRLINTLSK